MRLGTKPPVKAGWGNPAGRKGFQEQTKESETLPPPSVGVPQKYQATQLWHWCREPLCRPVQALWLPPSLCEPLWPFLVDSVGYVLLVSSTPLAPTVLLPHLPWDSPSFKGGILPYTLNLHTTICKENVIECRRIFIKWQWCQCCL